jgi:hypothetical protein
MQVNRISDDAAAGPLKFGGGYLGAVGRLARNPWC